MRTLSAFALVTALASADVVEQGPKDSAPSGLLAAVARADITPPVGIAHLNWGSQTHVTATGADPVGMSVTVLVVSDGRKRLAFADVDALSVDRAEEIVQRASAATGIPPAQIKLGATHTHAGPVFSAVRGPVGTDPRPFEKMLENYRANVADKIVGAIVEANGKLAPAHIGGAKGAGTININRRVRAQEGRPAAVGRNPDGFVDRDLIVARIDDARGRPLAVLVNFACHGTVLAYENQMLSPDWIGMLRKTVEQALPGAKCLFLQGAAGNQGPIEGFTGDLSVPHRLGAILGYQAAALALSVETVRREPKFEGFVESTAFQSKQHWRVQGPREGSLGFASALLDVPRREYTPRDIDEMATRVAEAKKRLEAPGGNTHQNQARLRRVANLLEQWKQPPNPSSLQVDVRVFRIGEVAIAAMPGEPFAEIGVAVKQASPWPVTMFSGYSNGRGGDYMPTAEEFEHGGYEVERTPYGRGAADRVVKGASALLPQAR